MSVDVAAVYFGTIKVFGFVLFFDVEHLTSLLFMVLF